MVVFLINSRMVVDRCLYFIMVECSPTSKSFYYYYYFGKY